MPRVTVVPAAPAGASAGAPAAAPVVAECAVGATLFEAGAQGEHKLLRGFEPSPTYSAHWIRHPGLAAAIEDFTRREAAGVAAQIAELALLGPYRQAAGDPDDA